MSRFTPFALVIAGALLVGGFGCSQDKDDTRGDSKKMDAKSLTLWERLGGEKGVSAVVDQFVADAAQDPKVNFARLNPPHPNKWDPSAPGAIDRLKYGLVTFISENTGGPLKYKGRDMTTAHKGMEITNSEFDAIAGHLSKALDKYKVPAKEKKELLDIVGTTRKAMVGK